MSNFSKNYYQKINSYKKMHTEGIGSLNGAEIFKGYSLIKSIVDIKDVINHTKSKSIIDFGCGKAMYYKNKLKVEDVNYISLQNYWDIEKIILYDPAVSEFSDYPKVIADGIISTDVIEHIPPEDVINFIDEMFSLCKNFIYVVIATIPASKVFENGENIHICLKTEQEWLEIFSSFKKKYKSIEQFIRFNS